MDKILVTVGGSLLIGGIYWFFFGKKEETKETQDSWNIIVEGGYRPTTVTIPRGKKSTITFTRKDSNGCLEEVFIPDYKIKEFLPLNKPVTITLSPTKPGTHDIHCAMNMFHGKIVVV